MKKDFEICCYLIILLFISKFAYAADSMSIARSKGKLVYSSCITTPPTTKAQTAYCHQIYNTYKTSLIIVASPTPLGINTTTSPYSWSEFDVCRYDAAAFVFDSPFSKPYCPSI